MGYHRFPSLAAAVAYSIERLSVTELSGAAIETDDDRYDAEAIRALYDHPDFPIPHRAVPATHAQPGGFGPVQLGVPLVVYGQR